MRMRAHLITSSKSRSRGLGSTGQEKELHKVKGVKAHFRRSRILTAVVNGPTVSIGVTAPCVPLSEWHQGHVNRVF